MTQTNRFDTGYSIEIVTKSDDIMKGFHDEIRFLKFLINLTHKKLQNLLHIHRATGFEVQVRVKAGTRGL